MTRTLRRELRKKIQEKVDAYLEEKNGIIDWGSIYEIAADAALELRGFQFKPQTIEAAIFAGVPVTSEMTNTDEKRAIDAFEQAFGLERPWDWYPDTPADKKKTWTDFRAYVLKLYRQDNACFTKYVTWSRTDYVKGAMTALGIKRNPENFPDSWSAYKLSAMYNKKTDEAQGEYRPRIGV